jgi:hypothetical protein
MHGLHKDSGNLLRKRDLQLGCGEGGWDPCCGTWRKERS